MSTDIKTAEGNWGHWDRDTDRGGLGVASAIGLANSGQVAAIGLANSNQIDRGSHSSARQTEHILAHLSQNRYDNSTVVYQESLRAAERLYNLDKQNTLYFVDQLASQKEMINGIAAAMKDCFAKQETASLQAQFLAFKEVTAQKDSANQLAAILAAIKGTCCAPAPLTC